MGAESAKQDDTPWYIYDGPLANSYARKPRGTNQGAENKSNLIMMRSNLN